MIATLFLEVYNLMEHKIAWNKWSVEESPDRNSNGRFEHEHFKTEPEHSL